MCARVAAAAAGIAASTECGALPISNAPINDASGRLRKEFINAKERAAGVMSVYPGTAKKHISMNGVNAVRSCLGSLSVSTQPMLAVRVHRGNRQSKERERTDLHCLRSTMPA
ncbi:hypothetical protein M0D46_15550 [Xanthomonas prunicola]|uniref:hypothetical protein n=1 Tax=Xanthomonas prunicola TaxID=2053930 RepID=UPI0021B2BDA3|nr:hypothetical protein [Xanthomonas prunicola]UXA68497.1 hypothetical protein M0D46_15550 [Xanthomonas prunicola]